MNKLYPNSNWEYGAQNYYKYIMHNKRSILHIVILAIGLFISSHALAMSIPRLPTEISIDGQIKKDEWQNAQTIFLDNVTQPYENIPAPVKTEVKYFENGETLYIAFVAHDPNPQQIRSFYHERDRASRDDLVGVRIDPYGDHRIVFEFFVNPYGVQNDSIENVVENDESSSWDGIWDSAGLSTDFGFQVEIAIPLRNFNFNSKQGSQDWAMEFVRLYPRNERYRISHIKIDRNNDCLACQMPKVSGFKEIQQGKSLSLTPTLVVDHQEKRDLVENTNWASENNHEVGLDIKWGISSDIFLNATINPDFSQIEADDAQISINDNFTLTLEEKRPFFLENQDIFSTIYDLVYTRNINAPNVGLKVTGRTGKHAYGVFATDDETTTLFIPGNRGSKIATFEQSSKNAAIRYRFDANKALNVGFLGTLRTSENYHNYVGSTDIRYKVTDQDILKAQIIYSNTQYPEFLRDRYCSNDADCTQESINCTFGDCIINEAYLRTESDDDFSGHALRINFNHEERDLFYEIRYQEISSGFRSDLGNQPRIDQNRFLIQGGLNFYGENDDWWNRIYVWSNWDILRNHNRDVIENEWEYIVEINAALQSRFQLRYLTRDEIGLRHNASILDIKNNTTMFDLNLFDFEFEIQPFSGLYLGLEGTFGDTIDFINNRVGKERNLLPTIEYSFSEHFRSSLNYEYDYLEAEGTEVFTAHIADFRFNYNHDLRHAFKFSLIYTDIERNLNNYPGVLPENYRDAKERDISSQFIYSYKINPQTVIFAGYSDQFKRNDQIENLRRDAYKVFLKFSYAWLK